MSRVFWIRHGPTHEKAFVGHRDVPADLSDTAKIDRLRAFLPSDAVVISSDLSRAVETANAVAEERPRLPHDPRLREFDFGAWDGLEFTEVAEKWPDLSRRYWETPGDVAPPNGESWNAAARRVDASVDALLTAHPRQDLIVVAHFGVILTQVQRAMNASAYAVLAHKIEPLSVTEIATQPEWSAVRINHQP